LKIKNYNALKNQRQRTTHYPRTYFILKKKGLFYLLFWLEYGKDNSLYIWFDDDSNNSWEVIAKHSQLELKGVQQVNFNQKPYSIFDPHISWHSSGRIHVTGYDQKGKNIERIISDKSTEGFRNLERDITVPVSQIVVPSSNAKNTLKCLGNKLPIRPKKNFEMVISKQGIEVENNGAPDEAFIIIEDDIIPQGTELGIDISVHHKDKIASPPIFKGFLHSMLFEEQISFYKGESKVSACIRLLGVKNESLNQEEIKDTVATCFNKETIEIFQLKKLKNI